MTKVVKVYLISKILNANGEEVKYEDVNKILWQLQHETRQLKNKIVQLCWEWNNFQSDYYKENGYYPKDKEVLNYSFAGYVYDKLKDLTILNTRNLSAIIQDVTKAFKSSNVDIMKGNKSIINYKINQPIDLHNKSISLSYDNKKFFVTLSLINNGFAKENNLKRFRFECIVKDNSTKTILERCVDKVYKISSSKLSYDKKKKMWYLNLCYSFENNCKLELDKDRVLGVDLGIVNPIVASVYGDMDKFVVDGDEIIKFRQKTEKYRVKLLRQGKYCGDGRIGHGRKTRCKPADKIGNRISRFRDTTNHKYSKALVEYAIKKGCGTIQFEDLSGISKDKEQFLKNWSYFDLQNKIKYKANEAGINVVSVSPKYTSQRCSKCGNIDSDNRKSQVLFKCTSCGYSANADYNASQNLAIRDIDKIISASRM